MPPDAEWGTDSSRDLLDSSIAAPGPGPEPAEGGSSRKLTGFNSREDLLAMAEPEAEEEEEEAITPRQFGTCSKFVKGAAAHV